MTRWHIESTRKLLQSRYGSRQLAIARNALRAVTVRLDHAQYHFGELRRLLREHIDDKLQERDIYSVAMPWGKEWAALQAGLVEVEAHMVACAQSVHSVPDALAHVAYYSAGLNLRQASLREDKVSLKTLLNARLLYATGHAAVEEELRNLAAEPAFSALDAVVNYAKHRGLPDPALQLEPEDHPAPYAMQFESFNYGGVTRPRVEVESLLAPAYASVSKAVVNTGNAINACLSSGEA
jgi:hypothetical protein